jgi:hypothetical protein
VSPALAGTPPAEREKRFKPGSSLLAYGGLQLLPEVHLVNSITKLHITIIALTYHVNTVFSQFEKKR